MINESFEDFRDRKFKEGYDQVLLREWEPGFTNALHTHPFNTDALVVQGEFWLTVSGQVSHFRAGDTFLLAAGVPHSERYGDKGAVFWAARKN